jgi:hypothetical protein
MAWKAGEKITAVYKFRIKFKHNLIQFVLYSKKNRFQLGWGLNIPLFCKVDPGDLGHIARGRRLVPARNDHRTMSHGEQHAELKRQLMESKQTFNFTVMCNNIYFIQILLTLREFNKQNTANYFFTIARRCTPCMTYSRKDKKSKSICFRKNGF